MHACTQVTDRASSGNALGLYPAGARFESRAVHSPFLLRYLFAFFQANAK